jgi:hypothetical protein
MTKRTLRFPDDVEGHFARRYRSRRAEWLAGGGTWPMLVPLGCPNEAEAQFQPDAVRRWVEAWQGWRGQGELVWSERRWRSLGPQSLPEKLILHDPRSLATWIGEEQRWNRASSRYSQLIARWPPLGQRLQRCFDVLADYSDQDMRRLETLVAWIEAHPRSNLYPRQIPVAGMDTKWLETRMSLVADLVSALLGDERNGDGPHERCGLKTAPQIIRFRLLERSLRDRVGGLSDVSAPIDEVASLALAASSVYIVENVQTGMCFEDLPGSVVFMGLGYGVSILAGVPWVAAAQCIYWGDLDTHGFAILSAARAALPGVISVLMDDATLVKHRNLWVEEKEQYNQEVPFLTTAEQTVYKGLRQQRWGHNVRLEQERIAWTEAWRAIKALAHH